MNNLESFEKLGLSAETLNALAKKGFEEPTPIQKAAIPLLLENQKDLIGQARTGTGKTAAFGLPIIEQLNYDNKQVQALILAPTRELAIQVGEELHSLKGKHPVNVLPVYGGQSVIDQIRRLKKGIQVVAGTPGRILDLIRRKALKLGGVRFFVLDEADEMLNMGFIEDVEEIMAAMPATKRTALFSATMPPAIKRLAEKYLDNPETVAIGEDMEPTELTDQIYYEVHEKDRFEALCRIIDIEEEFYGLVFCRTRVDVDTTTNRLLDRGYDAEGIHGDIPQEQREKIINRFRKRNLHILVATDVAARGLDISNLSHVINYALPGDPESYVHRIGRTGRAGKKGIAVTLITPEEFRKLAYIRKVTGSTMRKENIPEVKEIMSIKRDRIIVEIDEAISEEPQEEFYSLMAELLEKKEATDIIAALLRLHYKDDLDESIYPPMRKLDTAPRGKRSRKDNSRLYIALGKKDGYSPKKLVQLISGRAKLRENEIDDVSVMQDFSFATVPLDKVELVIHKFKKWKRGQRPLITIAKEEKNKGTPRTRRRS